MRANVRLSSIAAVLSGLLALASASSAQAQGKPAAPAKPAAAAPAKAAAAAAPAKPLNDKQKKDLARKLYKDAETKYKEGLYADALEIYKQAEDLVPVP